MELYRLPSAITPLFPEKGIGELMELAAELQKKSARLISVFNPITRNAISNLVEPMNSYYSNLIEGHFTHPLDIEKALNKNYSKESKKKSLQLESRAHVIVNRLMKEKITTFENLYSWDFISWLHKIFYDHLPEEFLFSETKSGKKIRVEPGKYRNSEVVVGNHIAPASEAVEKFMNFFSENYSAKMDSLKKIIAIAASHHRLAFIHPFLDGNGRVVRLFSEALMIRESIDGAGLWSISRGLAVNNEEYYSRLHNADMKRLGDYDGHGNLSDKHLYEFCKFFLTTCIDQVDFMFSLIEPDKLLSRIEEFSAIMVARKEMKKESRYILEEAVLRGKLIRGDMPRITGKSENVARAEMNNLLDKKLLISESNELRSPVMINFPIKYAAYLFPKLFPRDVEATMRD